MRVALLVGLLLGLLAGSTAQAAAEAQPSRGAGSGCRPDRLERAYGTAELRMAHERRTHTRVSSVMRVRVPSSWPLADGLLLGQDSDRFRNSLRCLVDAEESSDGQRGVSDEWRQGPVQVSSGDGALKVRIETYTWVDERSVALGPWHVEADDARWELRFRAPAALREARWKRIEIAPGPSGLDHTSVPPSRKTGAEALVWEPRKGAASAVPADGLRAGMTPPWQRAWAARDGRDLGNWSALGVLVWQLITVALAFAAADSARRHPVGAVLTPAEDHAARQLVPATVLSLIVLLYSGIDYAPWSGHAPFGVAVAALTGVGLALTSRARLPVAATAVLLGGAGTVVSVLSDSWQSLLAADAAVLTSVLVGVVAWCRRVTSAAPEGAGKRPRLRLRLRTVVPLSAVAAVLFLGSCLVVAERAWQRVSWLSDRRAADYGEGHREGVTNVLVELPFDFVRWTFGYDVLIVLALLALLRARGRAGGTLAQPRESVPAAPDRLLAASLFTVLVTPIVGFYFNNSTLIPLGLLLDLLALYALLAVGDRRAVLAHRLETSGVRLREVFTEAHRSDFLQRARSYREHHAALRRLDQGQTEENGSSTRQRIESRLRVLHRLRLRHSSGRRTDWIPDGISVVDVVLAWGPRRSWWENGCRAALYAGVFAVPAAVLMTWRSRFENNAWEQSALGIPDTLGLALQWEGGWIGAGFLLGVLWRLLPGRRGPARALALSLAYALPSALDALGLLVADESLDEVALDLSLTLLVLTLTALAMDLETFRSERRYWTSHLSRLLSIYQMRYFSAQVAYLIAQVVAVITIWQFMAEAGGGSQEDPAKFRP